MTYLSSSFFPSLNLYFQFRELDYEEWRKTSEPTSGFLNGLFLSLYGWKIFGLVNHQSKSSGEQHGTLLADHKSRLVPSKYATMSGGIPPFLDAWKSDQSCEESFYEVIATVRVLQQQLILDRDPFYFWGLLNKPKNSRKRA